MKRMETLDIRTWEAEIPSAIQNIAVQALEKGQVLFLPNLSFPLYQEEHQFLTPYNVDPKTKNISYDHKNNKLAGTLLQDQAKERLKEMVRRYALLSRSFLEKLIPHYKGTIHQARTSFRPVEIQGRKSPSYRKDDTLLHVDSFPANPTHGSRILRIFTNINPHGKPRVWRLGEPFEEVVSKIAPKAAHPFPGLAHLLKLLRITKSYRTPYDHYMLQIHNLMKADLHYQQKVPQEEILFPSGASWIVYTDQASHAAMAGQHVLEQTFHMPLEGLKYKECAPLSVLERHFKKKLV